VRFWVVGGRYLWREWILYAASCCDFRGREHGADGHADDNNGTGAAWAFARDSSGNWTQQGTKLTGGGAVNPAAQANSVAMSADGNTALIGGPLDQAVDYTQPALCATVFVFRGGGLGVHTRP